MTTLESLPPDIHFQILSHHFEVSVGGGRLASHPYLRLSAVSQSFRYTVESYCYHILQSNFNHLQNAKSTIPRPPFISAAAPTYRQVWLTDAYRRCRFCNASTKTVSSADSSVRCCRRCDRRKCQPLAQWANKVNSSQAAREYGIPEDTLLDHLPHALNGEFIMLGKCQVAEFAARFHGVGNIEEYLSVRREVCSNVQNHFVAESARLWMERHITLAVLDRKWREELEKERKSESEIGMLVQERLEEWRQEWERARDREWRKRYPWYGDIDRENMEIYRYMREQKEMQKRGGGEEGEALEELQQSGGAAMGVKRDGESYQRGGPSHSSPPAKRRHLADNDEPVVGVKRVREEENQSDEPAVKVKRVRERKNQGGKPVAEAKRGEVGENPSDEPDVGVTNSEGENQSVEPTVETRRGSEVEGSVLFDRGGWERQSSEPAAEVKRSGEGEKPCLVPQRRASV